MASSLRAPFKSPVPDKHCNIGTLESVVVRHPGYPDHNNRLISFVPTDGLDDDDTPGVAYGVVHDACGIIADNHFDGFFSVFKNAAQASENPVRLEPYQVLPVGEYYFHLPVDDLSIPLLLAWPVVPTFREWSFPHRQLPASWRSPSIVPAAEPGTPFYPAQYRDLSCRITHCSGSTELAHIIPNAEREWFGSNSMDQYRPFATSSKKQGQDAVATDENIILLRADVHNQYDAMQFSILPKKHQDTWKWAVHSHTASAELYALYHNRQTQPLQGIRREYLFARFAWDIFPRLRGFLQRHVIRRVKTRDGVEDVTGKNCVTRFCENQGRGRSSPSRSPKRKLDDVAESAPYGRIIGDGASTDSGVGSFDSTEDTWESKEGVHHGYDACVYKRHTAQATLEDPDPHGFKRKQRLERELQDYEDDDGDEEGKRGRKRYRHGE